VILSRNNEVCLKTDYGKEGKPRKMFQIQENPDAGAKNPASTATRGQAKPLAKSCTKHVKKNPTFLKNEESEPCRGDKNRKFPCVRTYRKPPCNYVFAGTKRDEL